MKTPINTVLIANRGEIALRIIRACRQLGLRSVAIYSAADQHAAHVRAADFAVSIGPAPAAQSYLHGAAILEAARLSGADAVHPGYGFLAENADFAAACLAANLVWIGPPPAAMRLLGDKIAAKRLARHLDIPLLSGILDDDEISRDDEELIAEAHAMGFPVLIKAAAGGGGRGMRLVQDDQGEDTLRHELTAARREAQAAFGDGRIFLERYLPRARHIEVQVLADHHGTILAVGDRDCSLQRRHQKIVEEAPAVDLEPHVRQKMHEAAIRLAQAAEYTNAGTIEFLVAGSSFYFLEVNTRLQVEHPVTEMVCGIDLVAWQLQISQGSPLTDTELVPRGHAIECRLCAEDPAQGFLPMTGTIERLSWPEMPDVRIDSGITRGDEVSVYYDSLLAKLIVHAPDRPTALERMSQALDVTTLTGITTNQELLRNIVDHRDMQRGPLTTRWLDEHLAELVATPPISPTLEPSSNAPDDVMILAALLLARPIPVGNPWLDCGVTGGTVPRPLRMRCAGVDEMIMVIPRYGATDVWRIDRRDNRYLCVVAGAWPETAGSPFSVLCSDDGDRASPQRVLNAQMVRRDRQSVTLFWQETAYQIDLSPAPHVNDRRQHAQGGTGVPVAGGIEATTLTAPMPGTITRLMVAEGDVVTARQILLVLEAMKMEHPITAPHDGQVTTILCAEGSVVPLGASLVTMTFAEP